MSEETPDHRDWVTPQYRAKPEIVFSDLVAAIQLDCERFNDSAGKQFCEITEVSVEEGQQRISVKAFGWTAHAYLLSSTPDNIDRICVSYYDSYQMRHPDGKAPLEFTFTLGYDPQECQGVFDVEVESLELWEASRRMLEPIMFHPSNRI